MGSAEEMKNLAQGIVSSYQARVSEVATVMDNAHQILEDFKLKRSEMSSQLRETLANGESLRKKDFDNMMKGILSHQEEREKEVKDLLKTFFEEQKEIAEAIRKNLAEGESVRISDFKKMLQDIQARQKLRENEVRTTLKEFQEGHREMAESLHSLLNKEESLRIEDFKEMLKDIRSRQIERKKEVRTKLDEFRKEHQNMTSEWNKLTGLMAEKRASKLRGGEREEKLEVARV
ncbi:MAG: hypothetical protein Q7J67_01465 [bacterium]|nr:hypothetical protein [bacterium]